MYQFSDLLIAVLFISFLFFVFNIKELFSFFIILFSAARIGLRDKGTNENGCSHEYCGTPVRIGIDSDDEAREYCWRCEVIFSDEDDPDPKDKEDLPIDSDAKGVEHGDGFDKVVPISRHKKKVKKAA